MVSPFITIVSMSSYLGQNFLTDSEILSRIASEVKTRFGELECDTLIEIGPGKGALTKRIFGLTSRMMLVEYDMKMIEHLQSNFFPKIDHPPIIVHADILQRDEQNPEHFPFGICDDRQKSTTLVVGNLPYYITSPILRKFFGSTKSTWAGGVFLIQKEVAEKIVHDAPKKSFLRWLINYAYRVEYCFSVPPKAFTPPPKVTSAVIRVIPKLHNEFPSLSYDDLLVFLDQYSPFKRKTLGASSKIVQKQQATEATSNRSSRQQKQQVINNTKGIEVGDHIAFDITPYSHQRLEELGWDEMEKIISS